MSRFILVFLSLAACGKNNCEFVPYLQQFRIEAIKHGRKDLAHVEQNIDFIENLGNEGKGTIVGTCVTGGLYRQIYILRSFWDESSEETRQSLIFHELGHCLLNRLHTEGVPSIMHAVGLPNDSDYDKNHEYYMTELFQH